MVRESGVRVYRQNWVYKNTNIINVCNDKQEREIGLQRPRSPGMVIEKERDVRP